MVTATGERRHGSAVLRDMLRRGLLLLRGGPRRLRRALVFVVPLLVLAAGIALYRADPEFLQIFRLKVFDLYQQIEPRAYADVPVKVIDLDDESLERLGQWPWPRNRIADLLARLFNAGAQVVAFDAVFAEPDRTSPKQVLSIWLNQPELRLEALSKEARDFSENVIKAVPDHDEVFVDVLRQVGQLSKRHGVVAGFAMVDDNRRRRPAVKFGLATAGDDPLQFLRRWSSSVVNLPEIEAAVAGAGSINMDPDADNIVRRIPLLLRIEDQIYPSLAIEALRVYQGASTYIVKSSGANLEESYRQRTGINHVKVGQIEVPVDGEGRMWLHFSPSVAQRTIPAWRIFDDAFDARLVAGGILFFGTSATGLKDLRSTPLAPATAGVEVHAQAAEQMLLGEFLRRPDWARGAEFLLILGLGAILVGLTPGFGALAGAGICIGVLATAILGSWQAYSEYRLLLDPVYPSIIVLAVYLAGTVMSYLDTEAERQSVRAAFAQYLSPELVEQLAREPDRLKLGGELREMTFLFCDVRGFTSISEDFKRDPQGLTRLINRFLTPMSDAIQARQGTIDKYMGDCIMAFWNAPLADPEHARHACAAALDMLGVLRELNRRLLEEAQAAGRPALALRVGIGINTGECVVGNVGSERRFDYSVLGDAVNLASRLEGQSRHYGTAIVIGEATQRTVTDFAALELDLIAVKGRTEAVRVYALLGDAAFAERQDFQRLVARQAEMLAAYRHREWDRAATLLVECRAAEARLGELCDLYAERIAFYRANPPAPDWNGVFVAETK